MIGVGWRDASEPSDQESRGSALEDSEREIQVTDGLGGVRSSVSTVLGPGDRAGSGWGGRREAAERASVATARTRWRRPVDPAEGRQWVSVCG
jgi:hypothetical protein